MLLSQRLGTTSPTNSNSVPLTAVVSMPNQPTAGSRGSQLGFIEISGALCACGSWCGDFKQRALTLLTGRPPNSSAQRKSTHLGSKLLTVVLCVGIVVWMILAAAFFVYRGYADDMEVVRVLSSLPKEVLNPPVVVAGPDESHAGDPASPMSGSPFDISIRANSKVWPTDVGATLPWRPRYPWRAFYIALNLYNNAAVLPHLTAQIARFLSEEVGPFFDLTQRVFISVFSNGSTDSTESDVLRQMVPALRAAGVPDSRMSIVVNGTCCGGLSSRPPHMDRIEWMACVRNAAMQPWYDEGMGLFDAERHQLSSAAQKRAPKHKLKLADDSTLDTESVAVLFFNDIFFAPGDMTALLETNYVNTRSFESHVHGLGLLGEAKPQSDSIESSVAPSRHRTDPPKSTTVFRSLAEVPEASYSKLWDGFDMACGMDFYAAFYDVWVTRGIDGRPFDGFPPYAVDHESRAIFSSSSRLGPVNADNHMHIAMRVRSCWNGVAAIRGSYFDRGLRFRRPGSTMFNMSRDEHNGGCYDSECLLICKDIAADATEATPSREPQIFLNPHVKVAYEADSYQLHKSHWFVSSSWYYPVVSWLRFGTWHWFWDSFTPPMRTDADGTQTVDSMWTACLLPEDTLPVQYALRQLWHIGLFVVVVYGVVSMSRHFALADRLRRFAVVRGLWWRKPVAPNDETMMEEGGSTATSSTKIPTFGSPTGVKLRNRLVVDASGATSSSSGSFV